MCTRGREQWGRGAGYRGRLTPEGRSTLARNEGSRAPHGSPDSTSQNATSRAQHNRPRCSTSSAQSPASASRWGRSYMRQRSPPATGLPRVLCVLHSGGDLHGIHTDVRVMHDIAACRPHRGHASPRPSSAASAMRACCSQEKDQQLTTCSRTELSVQKLVRSARMICVLHDSIFPGPSRLLEH